MHISLDMYLHTLHMQDTFIIVNMTKTILHILGDMNTQHNVANYNELKYS